MPAPVKTCVKCSEEFTLLPNKPGFANVCPACSAPARVAAPVVEQAKQAPSRTDRARQYAALLAYANMAPAQRVAAQRHQTAAMRAAVDRLLARLG